MAQQIRQFTLKSAANVKTRTETFEGRGHLVVPVIALVEGVVFAMNAKNPEYVAAAELNDAGWNGRPLFVGHPMKNGSPVSGNSPDILEKKSVGTVFNAAVAGKKLKMEAWIDVAKANEVDSTLLERVAAGEPIEISVGIFCETDDSSGEFNGKKYKGAWHNIVPDHLALLPEGTLGACSRKMGCGVRAAQEQIMSDVKKSSFLARLLSSFRSSQPATEMSDSDLKRKLYEELKELEKNVNYVEAFYPVVNPNRVVYSCYIPSTAFGPEAGMGYQYILLERAFTLDANGAVTLGPDVVEVEPVISYEPVLMEDEPIVVAEGTAPKDAVGKRNSTKDQVKIQSMHDHAVALGANCTYKAAEQKNAAAGAPCSCGGHAPKINNDKTEAEMKKDELVKFLETATEAQLVALSAVAEAKPEAPKAAEVAPAVVETQKVEAAVVAPKTLEQLVAEAPADVRDNFNEGLRIGRERKAATIKGLKDTGRCKLTDADLNAKSQGELDQLVELAGTTVRAAIDFGVNAPKDLQAPNQTVPAAPDMADRIRAARAAKK